MMNNEILNTSNGSGELTLLLEKLKMLDAKNQKQVKTWNWIYGISSIVFIIFLVLQPDLKILLDVAALLLLFLVTSIIYVRTKRKDYSLSIKEQLQASSRGYRFITPVFIIYAILAIPLIYVGIDTLLRRYILDNNNLSFWVVIPVFVLFYSTVIVIAYFSWRKKNKPILDEINRWIAELEK